MPSQIRILLNSNAKVNSDLSKKTRSVNNCMLYESGWNDNLNFNFHHPRYHIGRCHVTHHGGSSTGYKVIDWNLSQSSSRETNKTGRVELSGHFTLWMASTKITQKELGFLKIPKRKKTHLRYFDDLEI